MKITIETPQDGGEDEIIIRCQELDEELMNLIRVLKDEYGIELEKSFQDTKEYLRNRG